ncbi:urease accessory protein UreH [Peribacillus butanolivorans]|uniref:Urease accessory protein UreH n=1 Tax=Peribacillus butanolivorans TaxID=421767 RepID=A0AAX0RXR7_9BACI|nr:urease accessory protein UreH [Peribacillus butanolivorans]PEJ28327.1 urease accessory protein UreH [Peribacillus butanolivorans]
MENLLGVLGIGFLLGLKHALEPDHIIAVSTIAGKQKSLIHSSFLGVFWGIGHNLTLLGVFLILALTKGSIPQKWGMAFEMGVGVMLIYLGILSFLTLKKKNRRKESKENKQLFLKSMFIGQIHGLAGSAAMTLLVVSAVDSIKSAILYIGIFGAGTILGMLVFTCVVSLPFVFSGKMQRMNRILTGTASVISICYGIYYIYLMGYQEGLFI